MIITMILRPKVAASCLGISRATLYYFRFFEGAIRGEQLIEFWAALKRHIGRPLLIVWDDGKPHKSRLLKD